MTTETFDLAPSPKANPTLEESAVKLGIDPTKIDPTAIEQTADKDFEPGTTVKPRPDNIPEKFWDAEKGELNTEALLKSYQELEKTKSPKPDDKKPEPKADDKPKTEAEKAAEDAAAKSGLNLDDLSAKYWESGSLEDADYEALDKNGYPRHIVDQFIEGQRLIVERDQAKAYAAAGGEENYAKMVEWAGQNLPAEDITAYNEAINSGNINSAVLAVQGLKSRFDKEAGVEPTYVTAGSSKSGGMAPYESAEQMKSDMANPLYKKDPAFRKRVEQRIAISTAF